MIPVVSLPEFPMINRKEPNVLLKYRIYRKFPLKKVLIIGGMKGLDRLLW